MVSVVGRGKHAARLPDTPQRERLERERGIREVVFGVQDGILTTLGIVAGVGGASTNRSTIVITGLLSMLVGAMSMGVGEYLGGKAEREVVQNAIEQETLEIVEKPAEEFTEQLDFYRLKGFTDEEALTNVRRLQKNPDIWLHEMVSDEFGIDLREAVDGDLRPVFGMAASFAIGAFLPVLAYVLPLPLGVALWLSLLIAIVALFAIGAFAGKLAGRDPILKGLEIVTFGAIVFAVSWAAGHYVPLLFGHEPIGVGG